MIEICKLKQTEICSDPIPHIVGYACDPGGRRFNFLYNKNDSYVICYPGRVSVDDPGYQAVKRFLTEFFVNE